MDHAQGAVDVPKGYDCEMRMGGESRYSRAQNCSPSLASSSSVSSSSNSIAYSRQFFRFLHVQPSLEGGIATGKKRVIQGLQAHLVSYWERRLLRTALRTIVLRLQVRC